jgi:type II secretory pathway component GspD/PulD (secretin)
MGVRLQGLAAALLALAAAASSASDVDIRLERVSLYQLSRLVLGELLHEPYVLDGSLIAAEDVTTLDVRRIEPAKARELLEGLLRARGFVLEREAGDTVVKREERRKDRERVFVYRPKFRSVSYLQGAVRSFVPNGRFAGTGPAGIGAANTSQGSAGTLAQASGAASPQTYAQSAVTSVVPAQGPVLASQDVLIFEGSETEVSKLEVLIGELDRPAREVVVKAYVFEVGSSASDGSAVSLAVNLLGGRLTASTGSAPLPNVAAVHVAGIDAAYSILQSDARFKVLSSPMLRIRSGEHGKLSVGSEVPVLGAVSISSTGQPVQSVEYRSSGVILDLRADVFQGVVHLVVQQQVSTFVPTTTGVNASPTLLKRELATNLGLKAGDVAVLGGLKELRESDAKSSVPGFLSFLSNSNSDRSRSELILLLEASLIEADF